jgi:hypothetical protein
MLPAFAILLLMLLATIFSIRLRRRDWKRNSFTVPNGEATLSPISTALSNLVGIAGGIYLSVVLLLNFLKIPVPQPRLFLGCTVDPLAFVSLWAAIIQPFVPRIYHLLFKRR